MEYRKMGVSAGRYGMGWFVDKLGSTKFLWHSGTQPDFGAYMALLPDQNKGMILLYNASHHWYNPIVAESGTYAAALLAKEAPPKMPVVRMMPWMLRGQLLIPALQVAGVVTTLRLLRRWRPEPERRPSGGSKRGLHILLPLILNLLVAATLKPMLGKRRDYLLLYMPDYSWLAMICGSFALVWGFLRTGLVLRASRPSSPP
jgi:hypothetical protein